MATGSNSNLPLAVGLGTAAGGLTGLLAGNKKPPTLNIQPLLDSINQNKAANTAIAQNLPGQLTPLNTNLSNSLSAAENTATTSANQTASDFLTNLGKSTDAQGKLLSDQLRVNTLGALPELQAAQREASAATGGLNRGGANLAQENLITNTANEIAGGETQIALQAEKAKQAGLSQVYNMDSNLIQQKLGIDKDTAIALYNSGRTDLINEANMMLGINTAATNETLGVQEAAAGQQTAADIAKQQQAAQFLQSLVQGGTTVIGAAL